MNDECMSLFAYIEYLMKERGVTYTDIDKEVKSLSRPCKELLSGGVDVYLHDLGFETIE